MKKLKKSGEGVELFLADERLIALPSGALFIPNHQALVVADLHLGKSERNARRGGSFWPPYEGRETLSRLTEDVQTFAPQQLISLGDSFDDNLSAQNLETEDLKMLKALAESVEVVWIAGNHDPVPHALSGRCLEELAIGQLVLRHIAIPESEAAEISGHFHPKIRLDVKGRRISRKCFVTDGARLILPAYGAYTGGMSPLESPLIQLFADGAEVILAGDHMARIELARLGVTR